jgi:putative oxidoreductase
MVLRFLDKYRDIGLLILRIGIGVMFIMHGLPKLTGGPEKWMMLGGVMKSLGVDFAPTVWGFMAAFSECIGGLLLVLGFFTRPACFALLATMIVAMSMHISKGDPFVAYSHAMEAGILFISLILIGPGKYSLDGQHKPAKQASH